MSEEDLLETLANLNEKALQDYMKEHRDEVKDGDIVIVNNSKVKVYPGSMFGELMNSYRFGGATLCLTGKNAKAVAT